MRKNLTVLITVLLVACMLPGCACKHKWVDATCISPEICSECGEESGEALGHTWQNATCTNPMVCSVCAETIGTALGHDWKDATCTEPRTCYTCGTTSGDALDHQVVSWVTVTTPSCTIEGLESGTCDVCGLTIERALQIVAHTPGEWVTTLEPTESKDGTQVRCCSVCGSEVESRSFSLSPEEIAKRYKSSCKSISYKNLARSPKEYEGTKVKFKGKVVQVCSEASSPRYYSTYRVATANGYDDVVYIYVDNYGSDSRILEDDWITFYGEYDGLYEYTTVLGANKTIPSVKVKYLD